MAMMNSVPTGFSIKKMRSPLPISRMYCKDRMPLCLISAGIIGLAFARCMYANSGTLMASLDGESVTLDQSGAGNDEAVLQRLLNQRLVGLKLGGDFAQVVVW